MTVETDLKWLRNFNVIVYSKRKEIAQVRGELYQNLTHLPDSEVTKLNESIKQRSQDLTMELEQLYIKRDEIVERIDSLKDPLEASVLRLYYLNGCSWNEISYQVKNSVRSLQNIRRQAIQNLRQSHC